MSKFELKLKTAEGVEFDAFLKYKTIGDRSNPCILMPTCFVGKLDTSLIQLLGKGKAIDPAKYFIIVVGLFGGSESSSPSNQPAPFNGADFPKTTYEDNVRAQNELLKHLGVEKLHAYIGFSMGGTLAYYFATIFPRKVERIVVLAGSARCSAHNWSFLDGPRSCLLAAEGFNGGRYTTNPTKGCKAFARVYCPWALSPEWFEAELWKEKGYASHKEYISNSWENGMGKWDANDLLHMIETWQNGDIAEFYDGNLVTALESIEAKALIMPSRTDMYFRWQDSEKEVKHLKFGKLVVIDSVYGHAAAGIAGGAADALFINAEIMKFL